MTESIVERLTLKTRIGYGIGDIAICLYWSGVGLYLLYFYTDVVGISASLAGLIYFIGMAWDASRWFFIILFSFIRKFIA